MPKCISKTILNLPKYIVAIVLEYLYALFMLVCHYANTPVFISAIGWVIAFFQLVVFSGGTELAF